MRIRPTVHSLIVKGKEFTDKQKNKKYMETDYCMELKNLKKINCDKRCFIVGNGPSLTVLDLEKLKNEDCFACNRIYGLYDKTSWRPRYYCLQDKRVLFQIKDDLGYVVENCEKAFFPYNYRSYFKRSFMTGNKVYLFYHPYVSVYSEDGSYPDDIMTFSDDISLAVYDGLSITYGMIQIAGYMGYKEIYLLGIDHNYTMKNGIVDTAKSYAEGIKPIDMSKQYPPELKLCEISFANARKYCEEHGIVIKNATRGGKLEVFERILLEDVIGERKDDSN